MIDIVVFDQPFTLLFGVAADYEKLTLMLGLFGIDIYWE